MYPISKNVCQNQFHLIFSYSAHFFTILCPNNVQQQCLLSLIIQITRFSFCLIFIFFNSHLCYQCRFQANLILKITMKLLVTNQFVETNLIKEKILIICFLQVLQQSHLGRFDFNQYYYDNYHNYFYLMEQFEYNHFDGMQQKRQIKQQQLIHLSNLCSNFHLQILLDTQLKQQKQSPSSESSNITCSKQNHNHKFIKICQNTAKSQKFLQVNKQSSINKDEKSKNKIQIPIKFKGIIMLRVFQSVRNRIHRYFYQESWARIQKKNNNDQIKANCSFKYKKNILNPSDSQFNQMDVKITNLEQRIKQTCCSILLCILEQRQKKLKEISFKLFANY